LAKSAVESFFAEQLDAVIDSDVRRDFSIDAPKAVSGLIASGDRFIADAPFAEMLRKMLPDLRCVEMEGAALVQVCHEFDRPFNPGNGNHEP
jgi:adenosylhomocysteine nucleosidase